jgi:predicted permease
MYSRERPSASEIGLKIAMFPPFIAFSLAVVLNIFHFDFSQIPQLVFQKLGATVTPIALVAVGLQLRFERRSKHWGFLALGLFFKLIVAPAFFYLLYKTILGQHTEAIEISIMEAAMAPMITGAVLASSYGLKPKLASMLIGVGIPLSFITLAFWYMILNFK